MKKIAVVYSFNSNKSAKIASKIAESFTNFSVEQLNVESCKGNEFLLFDGYVLSVPTWFDGELPNYWDEILPALENMEFNGKKFALYGLGDQKNYPENFCDAVGILGEFFEKRGGKIIGYTSREGYSFESSKALKDNALTGLLLDQENQSKLSDDRIHKWVNQLEQEFN
jgi:flavodoxin I